MATCKDCIHYSRCVEMYEAAGFFFDYEKSCCKQFSDRSEWVHLPCKVGDTVFCIVCYPSSMKISVSEGFVREICFTKEHININIVDCECVRYANLNINVSCEDFGKTVFLTREEAEKALKERGTER